MNIKPFFYFFLHLLTQSVLLTCDSVPNPNSFKSFKKEFTNIYLLYLLRIIFKSPLHQLPHTHTHTPPYVIHFRSRNHQRVTVLFNT